jgi:hypothetical protein
VNSNLNRLPSRFPVGTRFVIEGRAGRIHLKYLEFPDGRHIDLPADHHGVRASSAGSGGRRRLRQNDAARKV